MYTITKHTLSPPSSLPPSFSVSISPSLSLSIVCDIIDAKLEAAKQVGADVVINTKTQNLREIGKMHKLHIIFISLYVSCLLLSLVSPPFSVMKETDGNGVGRLLDATGFAPLINTCFTLLR